MSDAGSSSVARPSPRLTGGLTLFFAAHVARAPRAMLDAPRARADDIASSARARSPRDASRVARCRARV
jgi:hypothetical protein